MNRVKNIVACMLITILSSAGCFAQKYEPTRTWPYLYKDFQNGAIRMSGGGDLVQAAMVNISLDGNIHYVNDNDQKVMAADMLKVFTARIGSDVYLNVGGRMMKLIAENENGAVVCETTVNLDELSKSDIGYGISSSTASTQKLSSLAGDSSSLVNLPLSTLMEGREGGERVPVLRKNYIRVGLTLIPASKKGVSESSYVDKNVAKAFFKANKIKWNDPSSLLSVVDFVAEQNKR